MPSLAALALLLAAGLWLRDAVRPPPLNVIFLTVESWRADAATPALMPNLTRAAQQGLRFTRHRAISAWTAPNIIAVLTGLSPFEQGVHARGQSIAPDHPLLLKDLAAAGWQVAGLQSFMTIDVFRNLGMTVTPQEEPLPWLAERMRDGRPFVLWYHYLATHLPYAPSTPFRDAFEAIVRGLDAAARERLATVEAAPAIPAGTVAFEVGDAPAVRALYDGGVAEFDAWFGEFWDFFNRSGLRDSTVLIVTADHGEELLERGEIGHASTTRAGHLHEEILHVPLFVWFPDRRSPRVVDAATDHTDLVPALRRLLGRAGAAAPTAASFLADRSDGSRVAATSFGGYAAPDPARPAGFEAAIREGDWKLRLRQPAGAPVEPYLYDLSVDPGERRNLAADEPGRVRAMSRELLTDLLALWTPRAAADPGPPSTIARRAEWVVPASDGVVRYADIADGARLEWTGDPAGRYLVEYRAGKGALAIDGTLEVTGTVKDFGRVGEVYWRTWVVPYGRVRLRVVPAGRADLASAWRELTLRP